MWIALASGSLSAGVARVQLLKGSEGVGTTRAGKRVHARGRGGRNGMDTRPCVCKIEESGGWTEESGGGLCVFLILITE